MPGAIDVEPNNSAYTIENIRIVGNTIKGSRGGCSSAPLFSCRYIPHTIMGCP